MRHQSPQTRRSFLSVERLERARETNNIFRCRKYQNKGGVIWRLLDSTGEDWCLRVRIIAISASRIDFFFPSGRVKIKETRTSLIMHRTKVVSPVLLSFFSKSCAPRGAHLHFIFIMQPHTFKYDFVFHAVGMIAWNNGEKVCFSASAPVARRR